MLQGAPIFKRGSKRRELGGEAPRGRERGHRHGLATCPKCFRVVGPASSQLKTTCASEEKFSRKDLPVPLKGEPAQAYDCAGGHARTECWEQQLWHRERKPLQRPGRTPHTSPPQIQGTTVHGSNLRL